MKGYSTKGCRMGAGSRLAFTTWGALVLLSEARERPGLWVGERLSLRSSAPGREGRASGVARTGTAASVPDVRKMLEITERNGSLSVQNSHSPRLALLAQFGINFRPPLTSSSKVSSWSSQPTIRGPTHG